jgi:hypothetical protein
VKSHPLSLILAMAFVFAGRSTLSQISAAPAAGVHQHFVCNTGYSLPECQRQMKVLRAALDHHQAVNLGDWTWVLVRSMDWKPLKAKLQLNPDSPAFTDLDHHETFFEEVLVAPVPGRSADLMKVWSTGMDGLLDLAVSHELGHALCHEHGEFKADAYGRSLRQGKQIDCK